MTNSRLPSDQRQLTDEVLAYLRMLRSLHEAGALRMDNPRVKEIAAAE
jgi:hypothetical protein